MKKVLSLSVLAVLSVFEISCSSSSGLLPSAPVMSMPSYAGGVRSGSLSENSVSSAQRTIVKSGSMDVSVGSVKKAGEKLENIVNKQQGYMTSMSLVEAKSHRADYEIRVPAQNLIPTMDAIAMLGEVDHKRIWVSDQTKQVIKFKAKLKELKARRDRYQKMLSKASKLGDKIELEKILSEVEKEIFEMELGLEQVMKHAAYSTLSIDLERKEIRGPLGLAADGWGWSWKKLFTIRG